MRIMVNGNMMSLVSSIPVDTLKELQRKAPSVLTIMVQDEETGKNVPGFKIGFGGTESISEFGIMFNGATSNGLAMLNTPAPDGEDVRRAIVDAYGECLRSLKEIEENVEYSNVLQELAEADALLMEDIEVL